MSVRVLPALLAGALLWAAAPAQAEPRQYAIDPEHLSIGFLVEHIGYAGTLGMFRTAEGSFTFDEETGRLADLRVVVDTTSVFTNNDRRDKHLRDDDFLDVKKHAQMVFTAAEGGPFRLGESASLAGELTLLGVTLPLTLEVTWNKSATSPVPPGPYVLGASARGTLQRSAFGMTYAVENGWVGDDVELIIELEAIRQSE
ncbi:MAG: YceI family protein [Candidatus Competibacteraceae bacterium]|nr:MAG: YceI family protein [Candidatus Competibacteraceae bacterium]